MKRTLVATSLFTLTLLMATGCGEESSPEVSPYPAPVVGEAAPDFQAVDTYEREHSLSQYRGEWVVLEWLNHKCPFVRKHYDNNVMQALQKKYAEQGVIWLSIVSSAPGKQGHFTNARANALTEDKGAAPHAVLIDAPGTIGRMYHARTTPHMFAIDPEGRIVYMGGIDDKPGTRAADLEGARPHVDIALQEAMAGKPVSVPTSRPYGCTVKY